VLVASYAAATLVGVVSWQFESDAAINLAINLVIVSFFAFFEEIGWRGYMLPKLASRYPHMAPALVGFLHGVWHLSLMLLTTAYQPGWQPADRGPALPGDSHRCRNPLRLFAERVWQPLASGDCARHVQRGSRGAGAAVVGNPATAAYLTGETGVFTLLALIIVAWVLVRRPATRKEDQLARDAH
jgi:uncharacterized protein